MQPEDIKRIRGRLGYSTTQIAEILGLKDPEGNGRETVVKMERGHKPITGPIERLLYLLDMGSIPREFLPEGKLPVD